MNRTRTTRSIGHIIRGGSVYHTRIFWSYRYHTESFGMHNFDIDTIPNFSVYRNFGMVQMAYRYRTLFSVYRKRTVYRKYKHQIFKFHKT